MTDDLVKRLRELSETVKPTHLFNIRATMDEAADRIEQQDEQLSKLRQRADELWQTLVEIHYVADGKEPNMDGRLWPLFITVVRDRIEALEAALREIACDQSVSPCTCVNERECSYGIARAALGEKKDGK